MKITSSSVQMAGTSVSSAQHVRTESLKIRIGNNAQATRRTPLLGDTLQLSPAGRKALEERQAAPVATSAGAAKEASPCDQLPVKDREAILVLQKMLELLTGKKFKFVMLDEKGLADASEKAGAARATAIDTVSQPDWSIEYDLHESYYESQTMSFSAGGVVRTADGAEIEFEVELNLSREFASTVDISVREGAAKVDPLVVNFDGASAALTKTKFSFDIDMDGDEDQISFATAGSGFLALDVNGDGAINDGSELFGPGTGDGFKSLAEHDLDGNGWIDENDDIYSRLRIWVKDEDGNDQLFALGAKGIGAIYLGNVSAGFDIKDSANQTQGTIAKTGVFLRENGAAGTIQHVDVVK